MMARFLKEISLRTSLFLLVAISVVSFVFFEIFAVTYANDKNDKSKYLNYVKHQPHDDLQRELRKVIREVEERQKNLTTLRSLNMKKVNQTVSIGEHFAEAPDMSMFPPVNYNVHIFYYPWYKSAPFDGKYAHWNHEQLPHWSAKEQTRRRQYVPPDEIGANFYPKLGPYSSNDPQVIDIHMRQIRSMGVGVLAVSWYPPHYERSKETPVDDIMMPLFDSAARYHLKIAFHIEPYQDRTGETLHKVIKYIIDKYGNHSAFYRTDVGRRQLPVHYVYDSYQIDSSLWADALKKKGKYSLRNTPYDGVFFGLLVERQHLPHVEDSGFDGFYTYFATNGFSYGSSWKNWRQLSIQAKSSNLIFVPSVGPGYLDTRVRPWNSKNTRLRLKGQYYQSSFYSAMSVKPMFLSITSYNEWHEGTQVEPAVPKVTKDFTYSNYKPHRPEFYLNMTRQFVSEYTANMSQPLHSHENAL